MLLPPYYHATPSTDAGRARAAKLPNVKLIKIEHLVEWDKLSQSSLLGETIGGLMGQELSVLCVLSDDGKTLLSASLWLPSVRSHATCRCLRPIFDRLLVLAGVQGRGLHLCARRQCAPQLRDEGGAEPAVLQDDRQRRPGREHSVAFCGVFLRKNAELALISAVSHKTILKIKLWLYTNDRAFRTTLCSSAACAPLSAALPAT